MNRPPNLIRLAIFLGLLFPLACGGGGGGGDERATPGPILLLAVDGLEWEVLLPLIEEGRLPTLARLMAEGSFGALQTLSPTLSPAIWTTVATGKLPRKHGIERFVLDDPDAPKGKRLYVSTDRKTKAFWNILGDYGRKVHVVGWFVTYPVEPVTGVMVAQTNTLAAGEKLDPGQILHGSFVEGVEGQVHPPERHDEFIDTLHAWNARLPAHFGRVFGEFDRPLDEMSRTLISECEWAFRADATYGAIARRLIGEDPFDLLAVYFGGADVVGHLFWRYYRPGKYVQKPTADELETLGRIIPDYYAYLDGVIGELLRLAGRDVTALIVSDHGMCGGFYDQTFGLERGQKTFSGRHVSAPDGVFIAAGPRIRQSATPLPSAGGSAERVRRIGRMADVTPTILALLGLPAGEDMDGEAIEEIIEAEFLARHPVRTVPSHDDSSWFASRRRDALQLPGEEERLEQLRALGYLD